MAFEWFVNWLRLVAVCCGLCVSFACALLFCFLFVCCCGWFVCTTSFLVCFLGWVLFFGLFVWSVLVVLVATTWCGLRVHVDCLLCFWRRLPSFDYPHFLRGLFGAPFLFLGVNSVFHVALNGWKRRSLSWADFFRQVIVIFPSLWECFVRQSPSKPSSKTLSTQINWKSFLILIRVSSVDLFSNLPFYIKTVVRSECLCFPLKKKCSHGSKKAKKLLTFEKALLGEAKLQFFNLAPVICDCKLWRKKLEN